ncbi:MAG: Uma2 family endonuclease [Pseudanabaenaceae cyanobacterium SKYGB_i_bin29]|nr:Uma2 family endonuclease [Pseudanabaenaceae cyanobacterium SKYG29]MDW8422341.1 Uma2 family endonuclease [Pseudanabaenaceae cyanobacterium SKYGB_i_bin29]
MHPTITEAEIFYPCEDEESLAETREHLLAIVHILSVLSLYLKGRAIVFSHQFFYPVKGNPDTRVTPDIMVVFGIPEKEYPNYKLWEGNKPSLVLEVTSESTIQRDWGIKREIYSEVGIDEYWLFDPYGEWIPQQLQGYRLNQGGAYQPIVDNISTVLQLRLVVEGHFVHFYRLDNNQKLLTMEELQLALEQYKAQADAATRRARRLEEILRQLGYRDVIDE